MKKLLLLVCLIVGINSISFAQLGKMQYEDAEEQFAAGKYRQTLALLDEAEASIGKTNPMIEHLRIMAMVEVAKQDVRNEQEIIKNARRLAAAFLKAYNGNKELEDKYREVYNASKTIRELVEESNSKNEYFKISLENLDYEYMNKKYVLGMSENELKAIFPGYTKTSLNADGTMSIVYFNEKKLSFFVNARNGKSYGYLNKVMSATDRDNTCATSRKVFNEQLAIINKQLGQGIKEDMKNGTKCTWKSGSRETNLYLHCINVGDAGEDEWRGTVEIYCKDLSFKN